MWRVLICFMQISFMAGGSYIKPGYDNYGHNKYANTNVCVQLRPSGVHNHEPYYLCNGLEFPPRQLIFPTWRHQQVPSAVDATKAKEMNYQVGSPYQQNLQFLPPTENHPAVDISPHHLHYPGYSMPPSHSNTYPANTAQAENDPPQVNLASSNPNMLFPPETMPTCLNQFARSEETNQANNENINGQQWPAEPVKHNVNPEEFNNLLDNEVLGTPNLSFSHDELLPVRNMPPADKPEMPLPFPAQPHIPREYLDDPVLRTFYNLDQSSVGSVEGLHFPSAAPQYNPVLQAPAPMLDDNFARYSNFNKCFKPPSKFPPIFIAIPWLSASQLELLKSMQPRSYGHQQLLQNNLNSYPSQYRDNNENNNNNNWSLENISNKNSSLTLINSNLLQSPVPTTSIPSTTEEDLFAEDTTATADKIVANDAMKFNEVTQASRDALNFNTTTVPPHTTTVTAFETMINAAKMHAKALHPNKNPTEQMQNKREVSHMGSAADHSTTVKKEYVKKLEKNYE